MATRPMSVFDNFTETYMKARDARAREERAKELSMRQFEQSLMAQDQNQRAWNQDARVADTYTNYQSPLQMLSLAEQQRVGDFNATGQSGRLATAGAKNMYDTTLANDSQYFGDNISRAKGLASLGARQATAIDLLSPEAQKDYLTNPYIAAAVAGQNNLWEHKYFDPNQRILDRNATEGVARYDLVRGIDARSRADSLAAEAVKNPTYTQPSWMVNAPQNAVGSRTAITGSPSTATMKGMNERASAAASGTVLNQEQLGLTAQLNQLNNTKMNTEVQMRGLIENGNMNSQQYRNLVKIYENIKISEDRLKMNIKAAAIPR